jgi:ferredoxin
MSRPVRLRFEPAGVAIDASAGERVLDCVDDDPSIGLPTACRAANCGLCLVSVVAGAEAFEPPVARERETLRELGAKAATRLGCQLKLRSDASLLPEGVVLALSDPSKSAPSQ